MLKLGRKEPISSACTFLHVDAVFCDVNTSSWRLEGLNVEAKLMII